MFKKFIAALTIVFVFGCSSDDTEIYDPITQLEADLAIIDRFVDERNLSTQIDASGIRYIIDVLGQGERPEPGKRVFVHYEIYRLDGKLVDTSIELVARNHDIFSNSRSYDPYDFVIDDGTVIEGFNIGTKLLQEGGIGTFLIPSVLAYRDATNFEIPPNANLRCKITLVEVQD